MWTTSTPQNFAATHPPAGITPWRLDLDEAADIVWATNATELYQLLIGQRGRTQLRRCIVVATQ